VTIKEKASPLNSFNVLLADIVSQYCFRVTFIQDNTLRSIAMGLMCSCLFWGYIKYDHPISVS